MTVIAFPTFRAPASMTWGLNGLSTLFTSPGGITQGVERTALWVASFSFDLLEPADWRKLRAFAAALTNPNNSSLVGDPTYVCGGYAAGTPKVDGASQAGSHTLATKGWPANQTNALVAGDHIQLATGQMLMVLASVNADASGKAAVPIAPYIRGAPADSSAIEIAAPKCVMTIPKMAYSASVQPPILAAMSFDMQEIVS